MDVRNAAGCAVFDLPGAELELDPMRSVIAAEPESFVRENVEACSRLRAAYAAGQIVGVPLAVILTTQAGWRLPFVIIAAALAAAAFVGFLRLPDPGRDCERRAPGSAALRGALRLWRIKFFRLIMAGNFCIQATRMGTYVYAGSLFSTRFGFAPATLGALGVLAGVGSLTGSLIAGPLVDRWRAVGRRETTLCTGWGYSWPQPWW